MSVNALGARGSIFPPPQSHNFHERSPNLSPSPAASHRNQPSLAAVVNDDDLVDHHHRGPRRRENSGRSATGRVELEVNSHGIVKTASIAETNRFASAASQIATLSYVSHTQSLASFFPRQLKLTPEKLIEDKHIFQTLQRTSIFGFYFFVASFAVFIVTNELLYEYVQKEIEMCATAERASPAMRGLIYALQCTLSTFTICNIVLSFKYHQAKFRQRVLHGFYHPDEVFIGKNSHTLKLAVELFVTALHVPPFMTGCGKFGLALVGIDQELFFNVQLLNILLLARGFLLMRFLRHTNRFSKPPANSVMLLYGVRKDVLMGFKDRLGFRVLALAYFGGILLFSYLVLCFERDGPQSANHATVSPSYWDATYWNCLWLVWACMCTVGLGDFYPLTHIGRLIVVVAQSYGQIISALLIGICVSRFQFSQEESNVVHTIKWMQLRRRMKPAAAALIESWYCAHKYKKPIHFERYYGKLNSFSKLRSRVNRTQSEPTNPLDFGAKIREVMFAIRDVTDTNAALSSAHKQTSADIKEISRTLLLLHDEIRILRGNDRVAPFGLATPCDTPTPAEILSRAAASHVSLEMIEEKLPTPKVVSPRLSPREERGEREEKPVSAEVRSDVLASLTEESIENLLKFPLNSPHGSEQIRREKLAAIPVMGLGMELDFPNMRPNVLPVSKSLPLSPRTPPPPVASIPDSPKRMLEIATPEPSPPDSPQPHGDENDGLDSIKTTNDDLGDDSDGLFCGTIAEEGDERPEKMTGGIDLEGIQMVELIPTYSEVCAVDSADCFY